MKEILSMFAKDESGATIIEYALICALVAVATVTILQTLGGSVSTKFTTVNTNLQ